MNPEKPEPGAGAGRVRIAAAVPSAQAARLIGAVRQGLARTSLSPAGLPVRLSTLHIKVAHDASAHELARAVARALAAAARSRR
jgi:tRNA A37 threonylcarbamoyladenosine synthetase subunit TsaC/SUA5/YrdC